MFKSRLNRRGATGLAMGWIYAGWVSGQVLQNPSFEVDTFRGTISSNAAISGWVGNPADRVGLDAAGGTYANNGATPDGSRVAFMQSTNLVPATLSTVISNLTVGQTYTLSFRLNARTNNPVQTPNLKVAMDNQSMVNMTTLSVQVQGGTTTPYRYVAFDFTAAAPYQTLWLTNDASTATTATTLLVDNFSIMPSMHGWSYAGWTNDASSGVDDARAYTHAYDFGNPAPGTVINGVTFKGVVGASPGIPNEFSIVGLGSVIGSDAANVVVSAGGGSAALAKRFIYGGNPGQFVIGDLVPGLEYIATFYSCTWEVGQRTQTFSYGDDRMTINQDQFGDKQGIRISYRYIAPPIGAITLTQTPLLPAGTFHTYGFANCEAKGNPSPVMGLQPRSQVSTPGSTATFSVTVGGTPPLALQWLKDGNPLTGQTNRFLTLSNVGDADLGGYCVVATNANGAVTSQVASLTFGAIANPSFEADVFQTYPGYGSGNQPVSGWTASDASRVGVNPFADGQVLFASNGTTPEGAQVGFLQGSGASWMSTIMNGLTAGQKYTLSFRANARASSTAAAGPIFHLVVDGQWLVDSRVSAVGGTNDYQYEAVDFTPTTSSPVLYITNDAAGNYTVLLDDFQVAPSTTRWACEVWTNDASSGVEGSLNFSHAFNFGSSAFAPETTINGVKFVSAPGTNPAVAGQFSTAGYASAYATAADSNVITLAGGGSARLAQSFIYYSGTMPAGTAQTLNISNLVPGVEYEATIYSVGWDASRAVGRAATFSFGGDRQTFNVDHFGLDVGLRVSYRYVADATGAATLTYVPNDAYYSFHTYGFSNCELNSTNAPVVYSQPRANQAVAPGGNVTLYALAGGQAPVSYQWQKDGAPLASQTNRTLILTNLGLGDTGIYILVLSNAQGVIVSSNAAVDVGLPLVNNSFEADSFSNGVGYVADNFAISGWNSSTGGMGLNPTSTGGSPFANNGVIPDGAKVAFIQADGGILSQVLTGLAVGSNYVVKFYENARNGGAVPALSVTLGGTVIVPSHTVPAGAYREVISDVFTATATAMDLDFVKDAGPMGGDSTVLLDYVVVLNAAATPPVFVIQPQEAYLNVGDTLVLTARATGLVPISYQWQWNGIQLGGETGTTFTRSDISSDLAGSFTVVASNAVGSTTSLVAAVVVGFPFTDLFNTGVDDQRVLLPPGSNDLHYQLLQSADAAYPGPETVVLLDQYPIDATHYLSNGPASKWIAPMRNFTGYAGNAVGRYTYRTSFVLDTTDPAVARIEGRSAVDDCVLDVHLNGVGLGISNTLRYAAYTPFVITNHFVRGSNTLEVVVSNGPSAGATALRLEWVRSVAAPLAGMGPQILSQPASRQAPALGEVSFAVLAVGSGPLRYQWYYEGTDLPSETNRTLHLTRISQIEQQGAYWVQVYNDLGEAWSDSALLTIAAVPFIVQEPLSQNLECGGTATFSVAASSEIPYGYVWYHGSGRLAGPGSSAIVVENAGAADAGAYTVVITNWAGAVTSTPAMLGVVPQAPLIISCVPPQTLTADPQGQAFLPDLTRQVVVSPTCSPLVFAQDPPAGTVLGVGATDVGITITDPVNRSVNCSVRVSVAALVTSVELGITLQGAHAVMSWPILAGSGWTLWGAETLTSPSPWAPLSNVVVTNGAQFKVTVEALAGPRFFRLQKR